MSPLSTLSDSNIERRSEDEFETLFHEDWICENVNANILISQEESNAINARMKNLQAHCHPRYQNKGWLLKYLNLLGLFTTYSCIMIKGSSFSSMNEDDVIIWKRLCIWAMPNKIIKDSLGGVNIDFAFAELIA